VTPLTLPNIVFALLTAANVAVSWRSLGAPRSHGFYRFFAFELILILFLMNAPVWFDDPFSVPHIFSWLLLCGSIVPALGGYFALRGRGKPLAAGSLATNLPFENTSRLVTTGIYRYIRHPMYASLLMLGWGIFLKDPSVAGVCVTLLVSISLVATARIEEAENLSKFGEAYEEYKKSSSMFVPWP
jgi:protein-S-isoprenylcysteine O-methyltransferase Ste14